MASVSRVSSFGSGHSSNNPSYSAAVIGTHGGNDIIYIGVGNRFNAGVLSSIALTVDGVAADLVVDEYTGGSTGCAAAWFAIERNDLPDPSQTDVDIAITYNQVVLRTAGEVYVSPDASKVAASTPATDFEAGTFSTNRTLDLDVDAPAGAIVLGIAAMGATSASTPPTNAWTGLTEDVDGQYASSSSVRSSANADNAPAETPRNIACVITRNGSTDIADPVAVAASFPRAAAARTMAMISG